MKLHGDFADIEIIGHLLVEHLRDHRCHDLAFARREG